MLTCNISVYGINLQQYSVHFYELCLFTIKRCYSRDSHINCVARFTCYQGHVH